MIVRCISWIICFFCYSLTLNYLKVGLAVILLMLSPLFQNVLFSLYFKYPLDFRYIYTCCISFIGICLLLFGKNNSKEIENNISIDTNTNTNTNTDNYSVNGTILGIILSLFNCISMSVYSICTKNLSKFYNTSNINYISSFWCIISVFILNILLSFNTLAYCFNLSFLFHCFLVGLFSFFGFHFINKAIVTADISKSSYIFYVQLPIVSLFGIFFYGESYTFLECIGFTVVLISSVYTSFFIN